MSVSTELPPLIIITRITPLTPLTIITMANTTFHMIILFFIMITIFFIYSKWYKKTSTLTLTITPAIAFGAVGKNVKGLMDSFPVFHKEIVNFGVTSIPWIPLGSMGRTSPLFFAPSSLSPLCCGPSPFISTAPLFFPWPKSPWIPRVSRISRRRVPSPHSRLQQDSCSPCDSGTTGFGWPAAPRASSASSKNS
uniref:Uncharacterized protein TCIL3000_1_60 n=1 Tax=Trypanosoma congolense (strain IL3000) TaxID=1068625 RepID=G0UIP8_TRYCI|nr:unnamed protein product [Trypanosoma congolense IL3000]